VPAPFGVGSFKAKTGNLCECGTSRDEGAASPSVDMEFTAAEEEAIRKITFLEGDDGEAMTYVSHRALEPDRQRILAAAFPECSPEVNKVVAVTATTAAGTKRESIALLPLDGSGGTPQVVIANCQITYEDLSPSECIEYTFAEAPDDWKITQLSLEALENYRSQKFESWRGMLVEPTCEAQLRRMLQIGCVAKLYDPHVFPTSEAHKETFQATDERTGKLIELPHPVKELRSWNAETLTYTVIDTQLAGAPSEEEKDEWWSNFLQELEAKHGQEYIERLMTNQ